MYTNNPYAQGGWSNPENPLSINNGPWGFHSPPKPSVYGALPTASPPPAPRILTFYFIPSQLQSSIGLALLNSTVVGPPSSKSYFDIASAPAMGQVRTVFGKQGKLCAVVEWGCPGASEAFVEVYDVVSRQGVAEWMRMSLDRSYRSIQVHGKWYAWVQRENVYSLFTVTPNEPELLARVSPQPDMTAKLEVTSDAVQVGLLDIVIVSVVLLLYGRV